MNVQTKVFILALTLIIFSDLNFTGKERSGLEILAEELVTAFAIPGHALEHPPPGVTGTSTKQN
jgi:hypothetical protein